MAREFDGSRPIRTSESDRKKVECASGPAAAWSLGFTGSILGGEPFITIQDSRNTDNNLVPLSEQLVVYPTG